MAAWRGAHVSCDSFSVWRGLLCAGISLESRKVTLQTNQTNMNCSVVVSCKTSKVTASPQRKREERKGTWSWARMKMCVGRETLRIGQNPKTGTGTARERLASVCWRVECDGPIYERTRDFAKIEPHSQVFETLTVNQVLEEA